MNIKKIVIGLSIILAFIFPVNTAKANTIYDGVNKNINETTIITEDNIEDVIRYLGLSVDSITNNDTGKNFGNITVGQLQQLISNNTAKLTKPFMRNVILPSNKLSNNLSTISDSYRTSVTSSSKILTETFDIDSYVIELNVTGQYSRKKWTGVGGISVDVDSDQLLIVYKLSDKKLKGKYTSSCITVSGNVYVDSYVGIGDFSLVKIGSAQKTTLKANFYASSYLY